MDSAVQQPPQCGIGVGNRPKPLQQRQTPRVNSSFSSEGAAGTAAARQLQIARLLPTRRLFRSVRTAFITQQAERNTNHKQLFISRIARPKWHRQSGGMAGRRAAAPFFRFSSSIPPPSIAHVRSRTRRVFKNALHRQSFAAATNPRHIVQILFYAAQKTSARRPAAAMSHGTRRDASRERQAEDAFCNRSNEVHLVQWVRR